MFAHCEERMRFEFCLVESNNIAGCDLEDPFNIEAAATDVQSSISGLAFATCTSGGSWSGTEA